MYNIYPFAVRLIQSMAVFLIFVGYFPVFAKEPEAISKAKESIIQILNIQNKPIGTGILITKKGHILTAMHAISKEKALIANVRFFSKDDSHMAQIIAVDEYFDLALLKVNPSSLPPIVKIGDSSMINEGDKLYIIGHPSIGGKRILYKTDYLQVRDIDDFGRIILHGHLFPGNSGGPALTKDGDLIGIIVKREENSDESYAIPINNARAFLLSNSIDLAHGETFDYMSELEIVTIKLKQYDQIMRWIKSDIIWDAEIKMEPMIIDKKTYLKKILLLKYRNKFDEQHKPDGKIYIAITPVFKTNYFTKEDCNNRNLFISNYESLYGATQMTISDLDGLIEAKLKEYNQKKDETELKIKDIESLIIDIEPSSTNAEVKFPKKTILIDYK